MCRGGLCSELEEGVRVCRYRSAGRVAVHTEGGRHEQTCRRGLLYGRVRPFARTPAAGRHGAAYYGRRHPVEYPFLYLRGVRRPHERGDDTRHEQFGKWQSGNLCDASGGGVCREVGGAGGEEDTGAHPQQPDGHLYQTEPRPAFGSLRVRGGRHGVELWHYLLDGGAGTKRCRTP